MEWGTAYTFGDHIHICSGAFFKGEIDLKIILYMESVINTKELTKRFGELVAVDKNSF